uniref:cell division protein n=1 Tax=Tetradesmus distendus TaxID=113531 RepID=UPI003002AAC3|nr:cell division protein [Tetradesmus distendus]
MKQKKIFFNKFHRKYLFLQNSLYDFLHWRTSNSFEQSDLVSNHPFKNKNGSVFLEQDKICLQEYWKSSENKKIKNALQNFNNQETFLFKQKRLGSSEFSTNMEYTSFFQDSLNNVEAFKKNNGKKISEKRTLSLNSSDFNQKSILLLVPTVLPTSAGKTKNLLKKGFHKNKKYITFQKKLTKFKNFQEKNSNFETLIPESDCFRNFQPFSFFVNQKIGQFFSKKTIFQQYWIFPLLGFVVLFSSPFSFFNLQKKTSQNRFNQKIEIATDSFFHQNKLKQKLLPLNFLDSKKITEIQKANFENEKILVHQAKQPLIKQMQNFSYFENSSKRMFLQFQNLENNEFQEFCNFYLKFFENSMPPFFIDEKENKMFQKQLVLGENLHFYSNILKDAQNQQTNFRKFIEAKRNTFQWKWFSLNSNFLTNQQTHKFSNFFDFEIPQKAEFFSLKNQKKTKKEIQNLNSNFLPTLDFSKAAFLLNEFEKDFNETSQTFSFEKNKIEHKKNQDSCLQKNSNFLQFSQKNFLNNLETEDLQFLQMFFSKKLSLPLPFLKSEAAGEEAGSTKDFEKSSKNLIFLQKWLQTQNFWKIQKKNNFLRVAAQFDFFNQSFNSKIEFKKVKKFKMFNKVDQKFFHFYDLMNLDSIYLQKVFQNLQLKNQFLKNKNFFKNTNFSNLSKFLQETQTLKNLVRSTVKMHFTTKQKNSSFKFKQQTFEFFIFQYYNAFYKNYSTQVLLKKNSCFPYFKETAIEDFKTKNFSKPLIFHTSLDQQLFEKTNLNNHSFFSPIIELKLPLFLDFSNKTNFDPPSKAHGNQTFFQKKENFQNSENLQNQQTKTSSCYFSLGTHQKMGFDNFFEKFFKEVPKFSTFVSSQNKTNLSLNLFNRFPREAAVPHPQRVAPQGGEEAVDGAAPLPHPCGATLWGCGRGWVADEKQNSIKANFYCSKNEFFEQSFENTLKNLKTTFFVNFSQFKFFKKSFLFEKMKKEEPFVFQNSQNSAIQNSSKSFLFTNSKKNSFFFKYSKSFTLKQKQDFLFLNKFANFSTRKFQKYKKNQSNFQSRKFEKIFKTFLSSLNKEKMESSIFQFLPPTSSEFFANQKSEGGPKKPLKFKLQNDLFVLNTLSNSLKNKFKNLHLTFFVSSLQLKNEKKNFFIQSLPTSLNSNFFFAQTQKFNKNNQNSPVQSVSQSGTKFNKNKDGIRPTVLLKRDGFVIIPKSEFFVDLTFKKYTQNSNQKKVKNHFYLSKLYQKEQNSLNISRFEKEKALQKKRRMKKQKLETRRRKKRKRFFPRPIWLRFHLYKKFLKIRHPETGNLENQKQTGLFFVEDQDGLKTTAKNYGNLSFAFPKLLKNQDFKDFSFSKTREFSFSVNNFDFRFGSPSQKEKGADHTKKRQEKIIAQKRWKNVFVSSFLKNQNIFQTKWKKITNVSNFQKHTHFYNAQNNRNNQEKKIFQQNQQKWRFYWKKSFVHFFSLKKNEEKLFYKNFSLKNTFAKKPNFFGGTEISPISQNREDYKISGEILSEFLRLSWKSYWFQMNFQPYTHRITHNFRTMQQIESQKNFSDFDIFSIFGNMKYSSLFSGSSNIKNNLPFAKGKGMDQNSQKNLLLKKALFKKFLWYCNIQNSFESKSINAQLLIGQNQKSLNFQKIQNIPEYNRILYARVSEILKNFKSSETNDQYLTQQTQKNLKIPKRKNEVISANSSFFTKSALFYEHFNVPSQPFIPAFSMFSSLFHDSSIKPTGELPTLRALWALHQTNFYHFQEKNSVRNLWTLKKRTDNLKSFKGTKKLVSYFRKYSGFGKFNAPKLLKASGFQNFLNEELSKQIEQKEESSNFVFIRGAGKTNWFQKNFESQKILFLSTLKSGQSFDFIEQLDRMSLQKFQRVQQKSSIFGINTFKQNSKLSFRYLKFHLFSKMQNQTLSLKKTEQNQKHEKKRVLKNTELEKFPNERKPNPQNSAKSSLNFWWSQKNQKNLEFLLSAQNNSVHEFDFLPSLNFSQFQNIYSPIKSTNFDTFNSTNELFFSSKENFQNFYGLQVQLLWFSAIIFHLALFFNLFKLPEIRSVFKFKIVLFYKFLNGFFSIIFSIHNLFKQYTTQGTLIVQKMFQFLNFSFSSKKSFIPYDFIGIKNKHIQNFSFVRNNWIKEKNFENLYISSLFDSKMCKILYSAQNRNKQDRFFFPSTDILELKNSTSCFFEIFVRLSEFSFSLFSKKSFFQDIFTNQKKAAFFSSQKKLFQQSLNQQKNLNEENLLRFSEKVPNIFSFCILAFTQKKKNNFLILKQNFVLNELFTKKGRKQKFVQTNSAFLSKTLEVVSNFEFSNQKLNLQSSRFREKKFQTLSKTEKMICELALSFLIFGKSTTQMSYGLLRIGSILSAKIFDFFEMILFNIYKFLEKPAELMIEWIALIFLIEWSSDMVTFIPDTFDISVTKSSYKFSRPIRSGSLIFSFLSLRYGNFVSLFPNNVGLIFPSFFNSATFFGSSNLLSYIVQKRIFYFFEHFSSVLTQPDMDILIRQRKGMIFWDIWAEILLKAAEKYNVNIPSFVTLKEEQELFIERLLQDKHFLKNLQIEKSNSFLFQSKQNFETFNGEMLQQNSLASFIENFLIKDCPTAFSKFDFSWQTKNIDQFVLSSQTFSLSPFHFHFLPSLPFVFGDGKEAGGPNRFKKELQISSNFISSPDHKNFFFENFDRWSCHQYGTYQGPETDLFVDIHPPKSLKHIQFFKYYEPAQYTLGSLICQIYSGIFSKQVAKNILVIGAPGTAKTLFIQALAGETEMKIITDNAYRYSMVQRGVAVGMKYLRDVFDALVLQTPCFFLMEHIHVIGSKRPFLISDDENVKGMQSSFGLDQQEVHETNQMIYQLNRHSISDYKRPYKGDFSMGIPTNFFIQNFYSKFEKSSTSIFKNSQFSTGGVNFIDRNFPLSPLPIDSIENSLFHQGLAEKEKSDSAFQNSFRSETFKKGIFHFQSRLQMAKEQIFAPPATSPFTILMMKEQKKLKPKKIVQETSWGGLSTDQMISYQKENSSVRAKVAVLADITMNLSRGKLDMITDLLVIIDSVRSNRGFVVFATTHLPSLLDPALRRPGRFDETISLAQSPNFLNRFEILKKNLENSVTTLDFLDSSIFTENFSELNLLNLITGTKLSLFHQYKYKSEIFENVSSFPGKFTNSLPNQKSKNIISQLNPSKALQSFLKSSFFNDFYSQKKLSSSYQTKEKKTQLTQKVQNEKTNMILFEENVDVRKNLEVQNSKYFLRDFKLLKYTFLPKGPSHILSLASSKIGIFLAKANFLNDPTAFIPLSLDTNLSSVSFTAQNKQFLGTAFYGSQEQQKLQLMVFLSGKISEFFIQKTTKSSVPVFFEKQQKIVGSNNDSNNHFLFETSFEVFTRKFSIFPPQKTQLVQNSKKQNKKIQVSVFQKEMYSSKIRKNNFFFTTFGNDQLWRSSTPFVFAIIQKRFLFTKNLLLSKMLFFENKNQRKLPPSPPNSSILMPSKKYENFKRTENDFVQKGRFSINEKIQMHQQQRFLKQLYNIPVQQYFRSEVIQNRQTFFSSSFQELAYIDSLTRRTSSSHFYQRKYLGIRHRFSNINQWWNGFLPEHNIETTYLSDVDWRTMFTSATTQQKNTKNSTKQLSTDKFFPQTFELTMDFPDAEQYYNPRNRRWYFHGKSFINNRKNVSYWFTFHTNLQYEIYYHYLMQSFHETFQYFDQNREMFDYFIFSLLQKGFLKELDCLTTISRFKQK